MPRCVVSPLDGVYENGGVAETDPAEVVRHLLAAAGTPGYGACCADFERLGEAGCDLLFALYASGERLPGLPGVPRPHPRDIARISGTRSWSPRSDGRTGFWSAPGRARTGVSRS